VEQFVRLCDRQHKRTYVLTFVMFG
jgi:hypothetical protein